MARRPIFIPRIDTGPRGPFVERIELDFTWHPGFALSQQQKSIASLHAAAAERGLGPVLEISSKSTDPRGIALSAFNLPCPLPDGSVGVVETAFQGSKVFADGGPYTILYGAAPAEAKRDERLRSSGALVAFQWGATRFPLQPTTCFYDWLYLRALANAKKELRTALTQHAAFSDIAFNPKRSLNCQAGSAALYVALERRGLLEEALGSVARYLALVGAEEGHPQLAWRFGG